MVGPYLPRTGEVNSCPRFSPAFLWTSRRFLSESCRGAIFLRNNKFDRIRRGARPTAGPRFHTETGVSVDNIPAPLPGNPFLHILRTYSIVPLMPRPEAPQPGLKLLPWFPLR